MAESDPRRWTEELHRNGRLVRKSARGKLSLLLVVCVVFALVGLAMAGTGGANSVFGILAAVFFGLLGIPALSWRVVTGRPVTVVDYAGVAVDGARLGWSDIVGVRALGSPQQMVLLDTTPEAEARLAVERSWWKRGLGHANTAITGHTSFALPTDQGVTAEPFAAWLGELHAQHTHGQPPG